MKDAKQKKSKNWYFIIFYVIVIALVLNKWIFKFNGDLFGLNLDLTSPIMSTSVVVVLGIIALVLLVFDMLRRRKHNK